MKKRGRFDENYQKNDTRTTQRPSTLTRQREEWSLVLKQLDTLRTRNSLVMTMKKKSLKLKMKITMSPGPTLGLVSALL